MNIDQRTEEILKKYGFVFKGEVVTGNSSSDSSVENKDNSSALNEFDKELFKNINPENINTLITIFNGYKESLNKQISYIRKEASIAVICPDTVRLLDPEDKRKIDIRTCSDLFLDSLFDNGSDYYKILTDYTGKELADKLEKEKKLLIAEFEKIKKSVTVNDEECKKIINKLLSKSKLVVVNDYVEGTAIKFIGYCFKEDIDEKKIKEHSYFLGDSIDGKVNINVPVPQMKDLVRFEFGKYIDKSAYDARPFFASRLEGAIVESVTSNQFNPVIGRRTQDNSTLSLKFNGAGIAQKFVFLVAGSRSGKGVLTLCQLGEALAKGYNTFYIDCKPDMAMALNKIAGRYNKQTFAIDGFNIAESKCVDIKVSGKAYYEYAYDKLEKAAPGIVNLLGDKKGLFVNLLAYTRAINNITYLTTKQAENNTNPDSPYGKTPCFVIIDEIEQYSNVLQEAFFKTDNKGRWIGSISGFIEDANTPEEVKLYLSSIVRYISNTWTEFGNLSQSKLGQSLMKIFVICQHPTIDFWCRPVAKALSSFSNGATFILGNESHQGAGSTKYGSANFKSSFDNSKVQDHLGMGKFILREGAKYTPFRSIFLLNEATRDGHLPSSYVEDMYGRLTNPAVRKLVNKEIFGIDDESEFEALRDKEMINTNIGFKEFTEFLIKKKGHTGTIGDYLEKGYTYLQNHISNYKDGVWEKFYDYSYESLGMEKSIDTSFITEIERTLQGQEFKALLDERYIIIVKKENRYELNTDEYLEKLKKENSNNHLWDIYEKQSKGIAGSEDVKSNINIFKDLLSKKSSFKVNAEITVEELQANVEKKIDDLKQEAKLSGTELSEEEIKNARSRITSEELNNYSAPSYSVVANEETETASNAKNKDSKKSNKGSSDDSDQIASEILRLEEEKARTRNIISGYSKKTTIAADLFDITKTENGEIVLSDNTNTNGLILSKDRVITSKKFNRATILKLLNWDESNYQKSFDNFSKFGFKLTQSIWESFYKESKLRSKDINSIAVESDRINIQGFTFNSSILKGLPLDNCSFVDVFKFNQRDFLGCKNLVSLSLTYPMMMSFYTEFGLHTKGETDSIQTNIARFLFKQFKELQQVQFILENNKLMVLTRDNYEIAISEEEIARQTNIRHLVDIENRLRKLTEVSSNSESTGKGNSFNDDYDNYKPTLTQKVGSIIGFPFSILGIIFGSFYNGLTGGGPMMGGMGMGMGMGRMGMGGVFGGMRGTRRGGLFGGLGRTTRRGMGLGRTGTRRRRFY